MSESTTPPSAAAVLRLALPSARRLLPAIIAGVFSGAFTIGLAACAAWLIVRASEQPPILYLSMAVVGVRAFAIGRGVLRYLERLSGHDAAFRQLGDLRVGVYERLVAVAPDGVRGIRRGDLLSRLVGDVDELQNLPVRVVQPLASAVVVVIGAAASLAFLDVGAAVAVLGLLALGVGVSVFLQLAVAARAERVLAPLRGELGERLLEHVSRFDVLTAFGAVDASREAVEAAGGRVQRASTRVALAAGLSAAVLSVASGVAVLLAVLLAGPSASSGLLDGPGFAVVVLVPLAIFEVAATIPAVAGAWRLARVSAERVATAVPAEAPVGIPRPLSAPASETVDLPSRGPLLELSGAGARWPSAEGHALTGIDFALRAQERVLVRGPSGAGKSTLAHVLVRFLDYTGSYRFGGVEANRLDADDLRRSIGLCEQQPWLFDDSIRQNLLFARDTSTDDDLWRVLDRVGLAEWARARGGLDVSVGDHGALVSGGQAQRLSLARALLADFPILVLDEPTANVDAERSASLLRELLDAARGRSVVLISHTDVDDDLIDRTVTIEGGRLVGS